MTTETARATETIPAAPRLNEPAPDFRTKTTHGPKKLSDDKGRWLVLYKIATPEHWNPGQPVIVPPPSTYEELNKRITGDDYPFTDWYFGTKTLPE